MLSHAHDVFVARLVHADLDRDVELDHTGLTEVKPNLVTAPSARAALKVRNALEGDFETHLTGHRSISVGSLHKADVGGAGPSLSRVVPGFRQALTASCFLTILAFGLMLDGAIVAAWLSSGASWTWLGIVWLACAAGCLTSVDTAESADGTLRTDERGTWALTQDGWVLIEPAQVSA